MQNLKSVLLRLIILIGILGAVFTGGYFYRDSQQSKQAEKLIYKDRIVTVTKTIKPDGTIISETKTEDKIGASSKKQTTPVQVKALLPKYSLGIFAVKNYDRLKLEKPDYAFSAGYRLIGNLFLEGLLVPAQKSLAIGLRIDF